jgi:hypothetical protein
VTVGRYDRGGRPPVLRWTLFVLLAVGVGTYPDSGAKMGRAGIRSTHHKRPALVPRFFQVGRNPVISSSTERRNVFKEAKTGSGSSDDAEHFNPQTGTGSGDACAFSGKADVLAGESAANNVNCSAVVRSIDSPHIAQVGNLWPMLGKHFAGIRFDFSKGRGFETGRFEGQGEAADA